MAETRVPVHVAIIMDGNGRWATERRLPRVAGHRQGAKRVKEIIRAASESGVKFITLFAFSAENWIRPEKEVNGLMRLLVTFLKGELHQLERNNVRLRVIGRHNPLPKVVLDELKEAEKKTCGNTGLTVLLALNYGARQEIIDGFRAFLRKVSDKKAAPEDLDEHSFGEYLYTAGVPDPDLLIRTSGEMRLSNFLLWQASYAELYFDKKYWPDFGAKDFKRALAAYAERKRKFGDIS